MNYSLIERHYIVMIFVTQNLCNYLLALPQFGVSNSLKYLLSRSFMPGCIARFLLLLNEFDITV